MADGWGGKREGSGRKKGVKTKTIKVPLDFEYELREYGKALGNVRFAVNKKELRHIRKIHNQIGKAMMGSMFVSVRLNDKRTLNGLFVGSYLGNAPPDGKTGRYYGLLALRETWIVITTINYLDIVEVYPNKSKDVDDGYDWDEDDYM